MRININGVSRDMTPEEEAEYLRHVAEEEARQRQQPPTDAERFEAQLIFTAMMTDTLLEEK